MGGQISILRDWLRPLKPQAEVEPLVRFETPPGQQMQIVWRVYDRELDWFVLREGRYEALAADAGGVLKSEAFPGLWLDAAALLNSDLAGVLAVLQEGIDSTGHRAFAASLPESGQGG